MKITHLQRLNDKTVQCSVEDRGRHLNVDFNLLIDGDIRGLQLSGLSSADKWLLQNSPAGLDLTRQIWKYFDGETLALPIELHALEKAGA